MLSHYFHFSFGTNWFHISRRSTCHISFITTLLCQVCPSGLAHIPITWLDPFPGLAAHQMRWLLMWLCGHQPCFRIGAASRRCVILNAHLVYFRLNYIKFTIIYTFLAATCIKFLLWFCCSFFAFSQITTFSFTIWVQFIVNFIYTSDLIHYRRLTLTSHIFRFLHNNPQFHTFRIISASPRSSDLHPLGLTFDSQSSF